MGMGYLAQEPSIFRKLTVRQNIMAILETLEMTQKERVSRLEELLDELELTPEIVETVFNRGSCERHSEVCL